MRELNEMEMKQISGGGFSWGFAAIFVMGAVFVVGVIDGLVRPLKCHN